MGQVLALLVENKPGVLARVVGLFGQRGYNIQSLDVAPTQDPTMSRITMETDVPGIEQVIKQINKLIDVIKVIPYDPALHVVREMALVRIRVKEKDRKEILALSEVFRARVVDATPDSYTFEITGQSDKIDAFLQNVRLYGIREIHRTGKLALSRAQEGGKRVSGRSSPSLSGGEKPNNETPPTKSNLEVKTNHG